MKRFFTVTNEEKQVISVLQYTDNQSFDSLLMQSISEHYAANAIAIDKGFKIEEYHGNPLTIETTVYDDNGDFKEGFKIDETAVYKNPYFPNGFESWQETHFEVVNFISLEYERNPNGNTAKVFENQGTGAVYELAKELTDEFEIMHNGKEWDGDFFEEIESFLMQKLS
jgi:hypothetical protein